MYRNGMVARCLLGMALEKRTEQVDGLPPPLAFLGRWFCLVADEGTMVVDFTVQRLHDFVSLGTVGHLDKAEAFGLSSELIDNQLDAHYVAKRLAKFGKLGLGDIERETANEKFHAHPVRL